MFDILQIWVNKMCKPRKIWCEACNEPIELDVETPFLYQNGIGEQIEVYRACESIVCRREYE